MSLILLTLTILALIGSIILGSLVVLVIRNNADCVAVRYLPVHLSLYSA